MGSTVSLALRKIILKMNIIEIIEYTEKEKVFENVAQAVATIVATKQIPVNNTVSIRTSKQGKSIVRQDDFASNMDIVFIPLNESISVMDISLNNLSAFLSIYQGEINLTFKREFYSTVQKSNSLPMVRGNHVRKWSIISEPDEFCLKIADGREHWTLNRIIVQQVSNQSQTFRTKAFILESGYFCGNSTNYCLPKNKDYNLKLFLALINSTAFNYYFDYFSFTNHITVEELNRIPVPNKIFSVQNKLIDYVDDIIIAHRNNLKDKVLLLERKIDEIIYALYGLTYTNVRIIDPLFWLSEEEYAEIKIE
jgi:hypothetical protein